MYTVQGEDHLVRPAGKTNASLLKSNLAVHRGTEAKLLKSDPQIKKWLIRDCFPKTDPNQMSLEGDHFWVSDRHKVVGLATFAEAGKDKQMIYNVCTRRTHRRQGIARFLIETGLRHRPAVKTGLNVVPSNESARKLYESLGFKK